jgi:large subunit ribosomal protein L6
LEIIGTGYKCVFDKESRILTFSLGYSHLIKFKLHEDIDCSIIKKDKVLRFRSSNFSQLYNALFIIKAFRKINIFKGKGIKFKKEFIKLKVGKKKR